jgi:hypothetical protein
MSYKFLYSFRAGPRWSCSKAVFKLIPVPSVKWINSWWWAEELPETSRVSCWSKFGKLVYLVGSSKKKFVTMHGHMNLRINQPLLQRSSSPSFDCLIIEDGTDMLPRIVGNQQWRPRNIPEERISHVKFAEVKLFFLQQHFFVAACFASLLPSARRISVLISNLHLH